MSRRNVQKIQVALLVATALAFPLAPPAAAAPVSRAVPVGRAPAPGLWQQAWGWLVSLWGEAGGCVDPNGRCGSAQAGTGNPAADAGGCVDPDGRSCKAAAWAKVWAEEGGCVDPNGRCGH